MISKETYHDLRSEGLSESDIKRLHQLARQHHSLKERDCNQGLNLRELDTEARIEEEIRKLLKSYEIKVRFTGDPRGFTVKMYLPKTKRWNTWGGKEEGYGI